MKGNSIISTHRTVRKKKKRKRSWNTVVECVKASDWRQTPAAPRLGGTVFLLTFPCGASPLFGRPTPLAVFFPFFSFSPQHTTPTAGCICGIPLSALRLKVRAGALTSDALPHVCSLLRALHSRGASAFTRQRVKTPGVEFQVELRLDSRSLREHKGLGS